MSNQAFKSDQVLKLNVTPITIIGKELQAEIYRAALPGSPEQSAVLLKPKARTAATLITQVSIETTSADWTRALKAFISGSHISLFRRGAKCTTDGNCSLRLIFAGLFKENKCAAERIPSQINNGGLFILSTVNLAWYTKKPNTKRGL